jgi:hypothetical protein
VTGFSQRYGGAALVTGASAGIGRALARALAARGMDVVLVARRAERLAALADELSAKHGVRAVAVPCDLAKPDAAEVVERGVREAGLCVGLLVNDAGAGAFGPFEAQAGARHAAMVDLNCRAPALLASTFLPGMLERGRGGLLFVASTAAYQPVPLLATYGATKAFDLSLAEALWAELAPKGIDVLAISPGFTRTELQALAVAEGVSKAGGEATPEEVAEAALEALGRGPSFVHGTRNWLLSCAPRLLPRATVARLALRAHQASHAAAHAPRAPIARAPAVPDTGRFQRDLARMLLTFGFSAAIDLVAISLVTGKLRFWFPVWLDPTWATRADPWVVYSQSYFAGIAMIPVLLRAVEREFLASTSRALRGAFWGMGAAVLAFVLWWKGGLMLEHHKEREALAWLALATLVWIALRTAEELPKRLAGVDRRSLLRGLLLGISTFFLGMAVVDPALQLGVHHLGWSFGLAVEVGFFVPAGLGLGWLARRLGAARPALEVP